MSRYVEMVIPREFSCTPGCSELLTELGCWSGDSFYQLRICPRVFWAFLRRCGNLPLLSAPRGCGLVSQFRPWSFRWAPALFKLSVKKL